MRHQKRLALLFTSLLTVMLSLPTWANQNLRLDRAIIIDPTGFGQPVVAGTLFIPHGWQASGGIEWDKKHSCVNGYALNWQALAPDGSMGLAALPQQQWEWNATGKAGRIGCGISQIGDAQAYLRAVAKQQVPNAKILRFKHRADLEQAEAANLGETNNGFQYIKKSASGGQLFLEFDGPQGQRMRGSIMAVLLITYIRTGGDGYGPAIESWTGFAAPTFASWALADRYDPDVFEALRKTYVDNPPWLQLITAHNTRMGQIERDGIMKRAAISSAANRDISRIINDTWQNQQQSSDLRMREFVEHLRDVETFTDTEAPGGTVELSNAYDHAWKLEDGTYVLTSDPSFNPYQNFGVAGEQLSVARR